MLHTLYTVDPQVFLYVIVVYYTTWATVFLWAVLRGERKAWGSSLSDIFFFGWFYIWGLLLFRLLAEGVCENVESFCAS